MFDHRWKIALMGSFACLLLACSPEIGDRCLTDRDCAGIELRTCDNSAPGGYCTINNCTQQSDCPSESVCVQFAQQRNCMLRCDKSECARANEGYVCRTDLGAVPFCFQPNSDRDSRLP